MKTIFIEDRAYDGLMIWEMLQDQDPAGMDERWEGSGIEKETLLQIRNAERFQDVEQIITKLVNDRYEKDEALILESITAYQAAWDRIGDVFYSAIASITQHDWKFPEYKVVVSLFHGGISNRGDNVVVRLAGLDPERQKRITAHEILMVHLWDLIDERFPEAKEDSLMHFWAMNEITAVCLLGLEPALNALWTENSRGFDNYLTNYPQLDTLKEVLKEMYLTKKDFPDFLSKMISVVAKSPFLGFN